MQWLALGGRREAIDPGSINPANNQAAKMLCDAQEAAQRERTKILESAQEEIASIVIETTEKLLAKSASGALDQFLDVVKEGVKV